MKIWWVSAAINGFLAVAMGAFAAHALRSRIPPESLSVVETAARYQLMHALALMAVAVGTQLRPNPSWAMAGSLFLVGTVLFSGSLYALGLSGIRIFGAITPLGGLGFLGGWVMVAVAAIKTA